MMTMINLIPYAWYPKQGREKMRLGDKAVKITKKIGCCAGCAGYSLFAPFTPLVQFSTAILIFHFSYY